jgi:hypothetical protein
LTDWTRAAAHQLDPDIRGISMRSALRDSASAKRCHRIRINRALFGIISRTGIKVEH